MLTSGLLVDIMTEYNPDKFDFFVVNGRWYGLFENGHITVYGAPSGDFCSTDIDKILCSDQNRLRGHWETVFDNFRDETYVAPPSKPVVFDNWDDDIAF
jgi:hypothetical protein